MLTKENIFIFTVDAASNLLTALATQFFPVLPEGYLDFIIEKLNK